jgi:hypothetical protein
MHRTSRTSQCSPSMTTCSNTTVTHTCTLPVQNVGDIPMLSSDDYTTVAHTYTYIHIHAQNFGDVPMLSSNDYMRLASTFHGLHAITSKGFSPGPSDGVCVCVCVCVCMCVCVCVCVCLPSRPRASHQGPATVHGDTSLSLHAHHLPSLSHTIIVALSHNKRCSLTP